LLLAAGTELLSAAAGVDTLGENAPSTPLPILFSFGMVTAAMGIGVTTGVMGSAYPPPPRCPCPFPAARMALKAAPRWRSVLFRRVLQRVYLFVSFRYGGTGVHHLSAGCFFAGCALLRSVANSNTVAIDGRAPCRQDQGNGFTGSHGSPANLPPAKGEGQDDANEWSTEFSVLATSAGCFLSIAAAVAVWVVVVCHVPVHRRWLPLGLFCLPLAIRWAALFGGGAPFVTTAHAQLVMMVGEISLSLTRLMLLPAWAG
jgi:hypothetical protein